MGPIGAQEMIAICVLALLLFGPKKLPELGKLLGKGLSEFRRAKSELKSTFESHLQELERETKASEVSKSSSSLPAASYPANDYTYPYEDSHSYDETGYHASADTHNGDAHSGDTQMAQAHATESHAVDGTVARSNGYQPVESASSHAKEEHPA